MVWYWGIAAAVIVSLATLQTCDPHLGNCGTSPLHLAYYGIPDAWAPYLRLAALLVGIKSGINATSPRPHSETGKARIPEDSNG